MINYRPERRDTPRTVASPDAVLAAAMGRLSAFLREALSRDT